MLTRGVLYLAAFVVASAAICGYAVFNQLSFPVVCGMMVLFTVLLAFASDVSNDASGRNSRSQMPATLTNHLQTPSSAVPGTSYDRDTRSVNDSNNSNCIRAHSDVQLSAFGASTATLSARTSARGHIDRDTNTGSLVDLLQTSEAVPPDRLQPFGRVPFQTELRRPSPSLSDSRRVAITDSIRTPARTLMTPSRGGLRTESDKSHRHVLPQFQQLTTGSVLTDMGKIQIGKN